MPETAERTAGLLTGCSAGVLTRTRFFSAHDFKRADQLAHWIETGFTGFAKTLSAIQIA